MADYSVQKSLLKVIVSEFWDKMIGIYHVCTRSTGSPIARKSVRDLIVTRDSLSNNIELEVCMFPSGDHVLIVESKAKLLFLDFVVYILSCLSFWFGFCPLDLANNLYKRISTNQSNIFQCASCIRHNNQSAPSSYGRNRTRVFDSGNH